MVGGTCRHGRGWDAFHSEFTISLLLASKSVDKTTM